MFDKQRIKVERPQTGEASRTGQPMPLPHKLIYEKIRANIQPDTDVLEMQTPGLTESDYKKMYVRKKIAESPTDIQVRDIITNMADGESFQVMSVHRFGILPHLEIKMKKW